MKSYNVIVTVSTTICVDADTPADAIKKVQKALDANDAGTAMQLGENLSCALRDGGYQVTNAVEVDELGEMRYDNPFNSLSFLRFYPQACLVLRKGAGQSRPPNRTHSQGLQLLAL